MNRIIFLIASMILTSHSVASSIGDAQITRIHLNNNGFAYVKFSKSRNSVCSGGGANEFYVIDLSNRFGELQYSHALSIFHAGAKVLVAGTEGCASPHNIETIKDFQVYK